MKVSVMMITYNHERFIAQAINSVLMQDVDFDYELVIGEDCSTDNTRNIVTGFRDRYPERIRLVTSDTNVGASKNEKRTLQVCQGEYVAMLEGDDYWTSSDKLQKQVDFLDHHHECSICFHNVLAFYEDGSGEPREYCPADQKEISTLEDLLVTNFIPTCSAMFRNRLVTKFPDWYYSLLMIKPMWVLLAQFGKVGYIKDVMGAYRIHPGGVWSSMNEISRQQNTIIMYQTMNAGLHYAYDDIISVNLTKLWESLAMTLVEHGIDQANKKGKEFKIESIFDGCPHDLDLPSVWKQEILSKIAGHLMFASYKIGDFAGVRHWLERLVIYDHTWLRNRGIWSIGMQAYIGPWIMTFLRHFKRIARKCFPVL